MAGDGTTAVGQPRGRSRSRGQRGRGRGSIRGRGRGGQRGHETPDMKMDVDVGAVGANTAGAHTNKNDRVPFFGLPSLIVDGVQDISMEQVSEDLKKSLGFQEPLKLLRLPRGGVRIFDKAVNQLTSEAVQQLWHGASVAGRWAFIPGEFGVVPEMISSGYLKISESITLISAKEAFV